MNKVARTAGSGSAVKISAGNVKLTTFHCCAACNEKDEHVATFEYALN
jgi:hypothetical protein